MITDYYADVLPDGFVNGQFHVEYEEGSTPILPIPVGALQLLTSQIDWSTQPSDTSKLRWNGGSPQWVETAALGDVLAKACDTIDAAADTARMSVLGVSSIQVEYARAEAQARDYAGAGYLDPIPPAVAAWANAKKWANGGTPWTGKQAADDIIATADRWYAGLDQIRQLRLDAKEHARAVAGDPTSTPADINAIVTKLSSDIAAVMQQMSA